MYVHLSGSEVGSVHTSESGESYASSTEVQRFVHIRPKNIEILFGAWGSPTA